jgi:hypothetical protein
MHFITSFWHFITYLAFLVTPAINRGVCGYTFVSSNLILNLMKTTAVNEPPHLKKNILDTILSFLDKSIVKVVIILFYMLFVTIVVKCQNPISLGNNNMPLTAMNKNIEHESKDILSSNASISLKNSATTLNTVDNSRKDTINMLKNSVAKAKTMITSYFHGADDADDHYKAKKSGKGLILVTTLLGSPVLGLLPAAVCSAITPKRKNLEVPSSTLVTNDPYMRGYKNEAHYIKKHNTWPCFVAASIVWVCVVGFIVR